MALESKDSFKNYPQLVWNFPLSYLWWDNWDIWSKSWLIQYTWHDNKQTGLSCLLACLFVSNTRDFLLLIDFIGFFPPIMLTSTILCVCYSPGSEATVTDSLHKDGNLYFWTNWFIVLPGKTTTTSTTKFRKRPPVVETHSEEWEKGPSKTENVKQKLQNNKWWIKFKFKHWR